MPQDLVITPNRGSTTSGAQIAFTGYSGASSIYLKVLPDSSLSFEGSAGQLFSITDNLSSGTIFSVNDITGIPSFDVNANGLVRIAPYGGNVALGTTATSGRLQINTGSATTIGQIIQGASGQTANYLNITSTSGFIAGFSADGTLYTTAMVGSANTVTNINGTVNSSGFRATVVGYGASVTGTSQGTAIGYSATAQNNGTQALGVSASATGLYATAIGNGTSAAGTASVAIGYSCSAPYSRSVAIGRSATALAAGDFVDGDDANDKKFVLQKASSTGDYRYQASWGALWIDSTDATHAARATFNTYYSTTAQEAIRIDSASDLARVGIGGAASGRLCVYTGTAANKGIVIQGFTSQTANLTEWQNSAGSVIARINASGEFFGFLSSGIVTSGAIASGQIGNFHLASGAVTSGEIGNASVVSGSISSGAVGAYHFNATGLASGRSLSTDGTGILSWATGGGGGLTISDDTSTNATRYLTFTSATTGSISTANVSSTKLSFNPSTGDFTAGGNITANSDARIKTNVQTISGALQKVIDMRGVYFDRIGTNIKNVGVIAQEIEAIVPELVVESDGMKSVAYGNIVAVLIEAIKEQNKRIEDLEKRLA